MGGLHDHRRPAIAERPRARATNLLLCVGPSSVREADGSGPRADRVLARAPFPSGRVRPCRCPRSDRHRAGAGLRPAPPDQRGTRRRRSSAPTARPSGSAATYTDSAPSFTSNPGTARISPVTSDCSPPTISGCARIASATLCIGCPRRGEHRRAIGRARARSGIAQRRRATAVDRRVRHTLCRRTSSSVVRGQLLHGCRDRGTTRIPPGVDARRDHRRMFTRAAVQDRTLTPSPRTTERRASASPGSPGVVCRADSSSPRRRGSRGRRRVDRLAGVVDAATARAARRRGRARRPHAHGLHRLVRRAGASGRPGRRSERRLPSASRATSRPRWMPSTKPDRTTAARAT